MWKDMGQLKLARHFQLRDANELSIKIMTTCGIAWASCTNSSPHVELHGSAQASQALPAGSPPSESVNIQ